MYSPIPSTVPTTNPDGTISAVVQGVTPLASACKLLRVRLPPGACEAPICGRFWMARCVEDTPLARRHEWSIYLRRPLHTAGPPIPGESNAGDCLDLLLRPADDPGMQWLAARPPGTTINLIGPFGRPFALPIQARTLLIISLPDLIPIWLPAIHDLLDRGGHVTLLTPPSASTDGIASHLPLAVELHAAAGDADWLRRLGDTLRWADNVCAALPSTDYQPLADALRLARYRVESGYAHAWVAADLACGFGACLACAVAVHDGGMTRACVHGPIFPLERITT